MQLSDLWYDVRPDVPSAPDFVIRDALKKSAGTFFRDSRCWIELIDPIVLVAGTNRYDFTLPSGAILLQLYNDGCATGVRIGQRALCVVPEWDLFNRDTAATGEPRYCAVNTVDDTLTVWPAPAAADAGKRIELLAVLGLTREATEIPDQLGERWRQAFVSWAKQELMNTVGKPWSNPQQGALEMAKYRNAVAIARAETHSGRYARPQRYHFVPFA